MPGDAVRVWPILLVPLAACGSVAVTPREAAPPGPPLLVGAQTTPTVAQPIETTTTGVHRTGPWSQTEQAVADCLEMFHVSGRVGVGSVDLALLLTQVANGSLTALPKATAHCALAERMVIRKYGASSVAAAKMASLTALLADVAQAHDEGLLSNVSTLAFTSLLTRFHRVFGEVVALIS